MRSLASGRGKCLRNTIEWWPPVSFKHLQVEERVSGEKSDHLFRFEKKKDLSIPRIWRTSPETGDREVVNSKLRLYLLDVVQLQDTKARDARPAVQLRE